MLRQRQFFCQSEESHEKSPARRQLTNEAETVSRTASVPQDGLADHVGIVEKVENGMVYTVEGNSGDSCRENRYAIGHYEIYGYGTPAY